MHDKMYEVNKHDVGLHSSRNRSDMFNGGKEVDYICAYKVVLLLLQDWASLQKRSKFFLSMNRETYKLKKVQRDNHISLDYVQVDMLKYL